jgi:hypothetical protein
MSDSMPWISLASMDPVPSEAEIIVGVGQKMAEMAKKPHPDHPLFPKFLEQWKCRFGYLHDCHKSWWEQWLAGYMQCEKDTLGKQLTNETPTN